MARQETIYREGVSASPLTKLGYVTEQSDGTFKALATIYGQYVLGRYSTFEKAREALYEQDRKSQQRVAAYIAHRDTLTPEQRRHEGCDHAYDICSEGGWR